MLFLNGKIGEKMGKKFIAEFISNYAEKITEVSDKVNAKLEETKEAFLIMRGYDQKGGPMPKLFILNEIDEKNMVVSEGGKMFIKMEINTDKIFPLEDIKKEGKIEQLIEFLNENFS